MKRKQIKLNGIILLIMIVLSIGCNKDDDVQPQIETSVVNEAPVISAQTFTAKEDITDDTIIGTIAATDPENNTLTHLLTQNSDDVFELTATGELSLAEGKKLDYETTKTYSIKVEVSDGTNKASADITVTVENVVEPFITTWKTTMSNEEIIFQLNDEQTYDFTIDWGDGNIENNITSTPKHTYTDAGVYTVSVSGVLPAVQFMDESGDIEYKKKSNASKLQTIEQWGDNEWESFAEAFFFCENMTYNATDLPNLSKVTKMNSMFYGCAKFNGEINDWDVSTVTIMRNMFNNASSFNRDLNQWDVSNVTDMAQMFSEATAFNGNIDTWNVSKVESMRFMFWRATSFNRNLSQWNVGKVTNMSTMFSDATSFNGDLSQWDVSNVTDMIAMFNGATFFNQDINNWNVSKVENMRLMFGEATAFNGNVSNWDVSNVTNMTRMFRGATSFDRDLSQWDISKVTSMVSMLDATKISQANYDALLNKWAELPNTQRDVFFGVDGLTFCAGTRGRITLIIDKNWTITGDSVSDNCF